MARGYVEGSTYRQDVADMILIAPVNHGSYLSKAQTALQFLQGMRAVNGKTRSDPLAHLGDGLGAAADDLTPGSDFLRDLNAKSRREGVAYHILAGDAGLISPAVRAQVEARMGMLAKLSGPGLLGQLEEITEGFGDGCVAVARSKLMGRRPHGLARQSSRTDPSADALPRGWAGGFHASYSSMARQGSANRAADFQENGLGKG